MPTHTEEEEDWNKYFDFTPVTSEQTQDEDWDKYFDSSYKGADASQDENWDEYFTDSGSQTTGSGMTAFESSFQRMKAANARFASEYLPDAVGEEWIPDSLENWGVTAVKEAEAALSTYRSKYRPDITDEEWADVLPSIIEKAQENALLPVTLLTVAASAALVSPWFPLIGAGIATAGVTVSTPMIIDEVFQEHADIAGIDTKDMTEEQKWNAWGTSGQNIAIEVAQPLRWFKKMKGVYPKSADELATWLEKASKMPLAEQAKIFGKEVFKSGGIGGFQEFLQAYNIARTSVKGVSAKTPGEYATETAVGAFLGSSVGTVPATSTARQHNKRIKEGTDFINLEDDRAKSQAGLDYRKSYNELLDSYVGPPTEEGDISVSHKTAPDVVPKLYDLPKRERGNAENFGRWLGDKLLFKSSGPEFSTMFSKAKTGKDVDLIKRRLFGLFGEVESGSGETQTGNSFNSMKHTYLGDFTNRFNEIKNKWATHYGFLGEFLAGVKLPIDSYTRLVMEKKLAANKADVKSGLYAKKISEARKGLKLSKKKLKELDSDIAELRKIHDSVLDSLNDSLGDAGGRIGYTEGYIARGIDIDTVLKNKEEFIQTLVNDVEVYPKGITETEATPKQRREEAERIYNDILNGKDPSIMSSKQIRAANRKRSGVSKPSFELHRDHRWDKLDDKFRKNDTFASMQDYLTRAATRAASAKVFGGNRANKLNDAVNEALKKELMTNAQAQKVWDMYDAEHNIYNRPEDEKQRAAQHYSRNITTLTAIAYLGLAPISSITEPAWISGRVGLANTVKALPVVAGYILKGIRASLYGGKAGTETTKSFGKDLLNVMGMAINPQINERIDKLYGGDISKHLTSFFRSPGGLFLTQYTNFVRVWTAAAGLSMIQNQAKKLAGMKGRKLSALKRELRENGMSLKDFKQMVRAGNGKIDILNDEFLNTSITKENGTKTRVRDMLVPWLRKITTDVALEPTVGNRPLWMSDPNMQLVSQLKSFPILFGNTIMKRTWKQMKNKRCSPGMVGSIGALGSTATAIALGALAIAIKDIIRSEETEYGPLDLLSATGIPWVGSGSLKQASALPAFALVDQFIDAFLSTDDVLIDVPKGAEEMSRFFVRTFAGAIFAEQMKDR
jgi:hypothetical protein